ncbi:MAG: pyrroline-5-carboxylate reductase [Nitriliruptoraceae bacterium]|nr:pyrroline-5-carboxylate reductase [Nitriliruptoraceae bacterium]
MARGDHPVVSVDDEEATVDGQLAVIGTGGMGEALLRGFLRAEVVTPQRVTCTAARESRVAELADTHGVATTTDNVAAIGSADVVLLAVKPQVLPGVLAEAAEAFHAGQTVISVAAGVTIARLTEAIAAPVDVVRVMTNTPAQVDAAMSVVAGAPGVAEEAMARTEELLATVGEVVRLPEDRIDVMAAMAGSGPAYLFLVVEALIEAGVELGLTRDQATRFAVQTLYGSGRLLAETGTHPALLREAVTSPGGSTAAGLRELEAGGVRAAVRAAVAAALARNRELGAGS